MFMHQKYKDANDYVTNLIKKIYRESGFTLHMLCLFYFATILLRTYSIEIDIGVIAGVSLVMGTYAILCTRKVILNASHNVSRPLKKYKNFKTITNLAFVFISALFLMDILSFSQEAVNLKELITPLNTPEINGIVLEDASNSKSEGYGFYPSVLISIIFFLIALSCILVTPIVEILFSFMLFTERKSAYDGIFEMFSLCLKYKSYLILKLFPPAMMIAVVYITTFLLNLSISDTFDDFMVALSSYYAALILFSLASYEERRGFR